MGRKRANGGLNVPPDSPFFGPFDIFGIVKRRNRPREDMREAPEGPVRIQGAEIPPGNFDAPYKSACRAHAPCLITARSRSLQSFQEGIEERYSSPAAKPPTPRPQAHGPTTAAPAAQGRTRTAGPRGAGPRGRTRAGPERPAAPGTARAEGGRAAGRAESAPAQPNKIKGSVLLGCVTANPTTTGILLGWVS